MIKTFIAFLAATAIAFGCESKQDTPAANGAPNTSVTTDTKEPVADKGSPADESQDPAKETATAATQAGGLGPNAAPGATAPKAGEDVAVITTNYGKIVLKFFGDKAPGHVKNFKELANKKFYDGTKFHRVIPGFMIQGGDPNSKDADRGNDGTGGPGYAIKAEFNDTKHARGILSMARSQDPDSAGSQFFITVADANFLDGQYTAFGQVVDGMDVVDKIVALDRDPRDNPVPGKDAVMKTVRIEKWPLKK